MYETDMESKAFGECALCRVSHFLSIVSESRAEYKYCPYCGELLKPIYGA